MSELEELRRVIQDLASERDEQIYANKFLTREVCKLKADLAAVQEMCHKQTKSSIKLQNEYRQMKKAYSELCEKYEQDRASHKQAVSLCKCLEQANIELKCCLEQAQRNEERLKMYCKKCSEERRNLKKCVQELQVMKGCLEQENQRLRQSWQERKMHKIQTAGSQMKKRVLNSTKNSIVLNCKLQQMLDKMNCENNCLKKRVLQLEKSIICGSSVATPRRNIRMRSCPNRTQSKINNRPCSRVNNFKKSPKQFCTCTQNRPISCPSTNMKVNEPKREKSVTFAQDPSMMKCKPTHPVESRSAPEVARKPAPVVRKPAARKPTPVACKRSSSVASKRSSSIAGRRPTPVAPRRSTPGSCKPAPSSCKPAPVARKPTGKLAVERNLAPVECKPSSVPCKSPYTSSSIRTTRTRACKPVFLMECTSKSSSVASKSATSVCRTASKNTRRRRLRRRDCCVVM